MGPNFYPSETRKLIVSSKLFFRKKEENASEIFIRAAFLFSAYLNPSAIDVNQFLKKLSHLTWPSYTY